jgi:dTMP kinase
MFITFEGCEGSGKTTQAKMLVESLKSKGIDAIFTREPGGSALAEEIRTLVLRQEIEDPMTEFLLITAARRDHVEKTIKPALAQGKYVICDRFLHSSLAYQGYAKGLNLDLMSQIHKLSVGGFMPDVTFIIDVEPDIAIARINKHRAESDMNYYDKKGQNFHQTIRNAFADMASSLKYGQVVKIDGGGDKEATAQSVLNALRNV